MAKVGRKPGTPKTGGRKPGSPNKISKTLKEDILEAADLAGGPGGRVAYLKEMAIENKSAFAGLLGKILPTQLTGDEGKPIQMQVQRDPKDMSPDEIKALMQSVAQAKGILSGASDADEEPDGED